ncbi:MAG TPA: alpha/beta fold hydrolase [Bacillota bacterium]|nr:alpha/beta fold hydrolase [Bacillota bacterium]
MSIGCLMLHGFTGGTYEVGPLAYHLQEHTTWDIRLPTLPGHEKNARIEEATHEEWLERAESILQDLLQKNDTVYIIGFSMGGMIAAYLAATYPVEKVVFLAPAVKVLSVRQLTIDVSEVVADGFRGRLNENVIYEHYKAKLRTVPARAGFEFLKLQRYTRPYLKEVTVPVFIAHGRQDTIVPVQTVHYLQREIPSAKKQVVIFDRSRHLLCLGEDQHVLIRMVYEFLTSK